jgi:hypothetical protein
MRPLDDLLDPGNAGIQSVRDWMRAAVRPVEMLPPSVDRDDALVAMQVTTRSPMGAVVHETGGILFDHGWLRVLGSGHPRLSRSLPGWNVGKDDGLLLVADDAIGGFFAINGGALGSDAKEVFYLAPDSLDWEPLGGGYSDFLVWACSGDLDQFYDWIRWPGWADEVAALPGDRCWTFYPFLFTTEGAGGKGRRTDVPVDEIWRLHLQLRKQLGGSGGAA